MTFFSNTYSTIIYQKQPLYNDENIFHILLYSFPEEEILVVIFRS